MIYFFAWGAFVVVLVAAACTCFAVEPSDAKPATQPSGFRAAAVRYQAGDVERSIRFYTGHLGFKLEDKGGPGPAFAKISNGTLALWLSGPKSSGSRQMPDGRAQQPGGWNRIVLEVNDVAAAVEALKKAGIRFRNDIETGPGGKQIQIEDPDGNPIELFQPAPSPAP
jgi:glyoxylase I family protein